MEKINFKRSDLIYQGRNGTGRCLGLALCGGVDSKCFRVLPINSKGDTSNCFIEIDRASIPDLIKALEAMR